MKVTLPIFFILLNFFTKAQQISIDSIITKQSLQYTIGALANDSMMGRFTGTLQAKDAATFIANRFKEAGLKSLSNHDDYFSNYSFIYKDIKINGINVVGILPGNIVQDTIVIISAHYDHIGYLSNSLNTTDTVFNGANDNASGVSVIVELATYYASIKNNRYTLMFIAFSGEELGEKGSAYQASLIDPSHIHAVINFDMVGRPISNKTKKCMVASQTTFPVLKKLNNALDNNDHFFIADQFPEQHLFTRSDQYSFKNVSKCFLLMATPPTDEFYHNLKDEYDSIDFDFLLVVTKKVAIACQIFIK